jgi:hypothetical protein
MRFYRLSLFRGFGYLVIGTFIGVLITILIRLLVGLPAWNAEPVLVAGAVMGSIAFMFGTGVLDDWLKWARGCLFRSQSNRYPIWIDFFNNPVSCRFVRHDFPH